MYPFRRRRNCNSIDDNKHNGLGRQRTFNRNDQGEPGLEFEDRFNYTQKEPSVYHAKKDGDTLAEKEKILMTSFKGNNHLMPSTSVKEKTFNNSIPLNINSKGSKRTLTSERSTS